MTREALPKMISVRTFANRVRVNELREKLLCDGVQCMNCPLRRRDGAGWCCKLKGPFLGHAKIIAWIATHEVASKLELI